MKAAKKKTRPHKVKEEDFVADLFYNPEDPEEFRIVGQGKIQIWSVKAAARELGITRRRIQDVLDENQVKPVKSIVYKYSKLKIGGYLMSDIFTVLQKKIEEQFTENNRSLRFKGKGNSGDGKVIHGKFGEEIRLTRARADKAELELQEAAAALIEVADVVQDVGDMLASFKARLLGLAPKLASSVPPDIRAEVETNARVLVTEALEEIAQYKPRVHRRAGSNDEAAADSQGK